MNNQNKNSDFYIRLGYLRQIGNFLAESGHNLQPLLRDAEYRALEQKNSGEYVSLSVASRWLALMQRISGDPHFGLRIGAKLFHASHGFLGHILFNSPTLRTSIEVGRKYQPTLYNFLDYRLLVRDDVASIRICPAIQLGPGADLFYDIALVFVNDLIRSNGKGRAILAVRFTRPQPEDTSVYADTFQAPLEFGSRFNEIEFESWILDVPSNLYDEYLFTQAIEQCDKQLRRVMPNSDVSDTVIDLLKKNFGHDLKLADVSNQLRISPRTLRRRLLEEGTNFQALKRHTRCNAAAEYLAHTSLSVAEIASRLGYPDSSSFGKAFRQWKGLTPRQYRNKYA